MAQMHGTVTAVKSTIPDGAYRVRITECIEKPTEDKKDSFTLYVRFTILEGDYRGRFILDKFLTYDPSNSEYFKICQQKLGDLAIACGYEKGRQITDTDEFMNREVAITKKTVLSKDGNEYARYTYNQVNNNIPSSSTPVFVNGDNNAPQRPQTQSYESWSL